MIVLYRFSLVLLSLMLSLSVSAQTVTIETVLDTHKIEIGDRAELIYMINKSSDRTIVLPDLKDTLIDGLEVLDAPIIDSISSKDGSVRIEQKLSITSFEEGMYYIPPQPFGLRTEYGTDTVFSKESYLEVVGVEIDTTGTIRDIAGLERAPIIFRDFLPFIVLIGIAGLIILIIYLIRRYKRAKGLISVPQKPAEPAHVIALRELDKLKAQKLWQQDETKEYYTRLTGIVRTYIEDRYNVLAMEKPSSEILRELRQMHYSKKIDFSKFESLLNLADLIKFAKGSALAEENIEHLDNAYNLVKTTYVEIEEQDSINDKTEAK